MLPSEFYSTLSKDLTALLTDTSDYNMIITVGEEPDVKKYYVHSNILRVRSKYFSKAVSADWARKENGIILFSKPNIESDVFDIILRFIYGGKIYFTDKMSPSKIFDCLKAADELCLDEFLDYAQSYLLERKDWLKDNLFLLYRDTFQPSSLTKLQEYCINQIRKYPLKLFNSSEFITLPKVCLEELVQDDLLEISELQLFEKLIEWGIANTEDLTQTNINKFSEKDFTSLSLTLEKLLKHIRFYHMESNDFYSKVTPLKAVLGTNFYDEMEVYHNKSTTTSTNGDGIVSNSSIPKPKKFINLLPNRGAIISKIMNLQQGAIISSWIDKKDLEKNDNVNYTTENNPYNFKLLLRGSKDGLSSSTFHNKVKKCRSTITLFKLKNHDDFFIGGYNPEEWDSPYWPRFKQSSNAFLFSFSSDGSINSNNNQKDEDLIQPDDIIPDKQGRIARIRKEDEKYALNLWRSTGPSFGKFDILMQAGGIRLKHNSYVPNVIPLQDGENYKIEEYEVFEVTQKVDESGGEKDKESNDVVVEIIE